MTTTAPTTAAPTTTTSRTEQKTKISSDFDTFLRMLTTQLQNQDPLNPMESSDFAVQLATFSGVEQAQRTNQLLEGMAGNMGMTGMTQLATWVGMEARAPAPVQYEGKPLTLSATPASLADDATLVVRNANGTVVSRQQVPVSIEPMSWDGTADDGSALPQGRYSFELESLREGQVIATTPVETYGRVVEARAGAAGTTLVMAGGIEIAANAVTAIRKP